MNNAISKGNISGTDGAQQGKIRFIHLRRQAVFLKGGTLKNLGSMATGGLTVAYMQAHDGTLTIAFARCNPNDQYNKAVGRAQALARLESKEDTWHKWLNTQQDTFDTIYDLARSRSIFYKNLHARVR